MKAKDTAMGENQLIEVVYLAIETPDKDADEGWKVKERFKAVCKAQAEISFKAGIREVVEWVNKHNYMTNPEMSFVSVNGARWQAKLKEWNV